MATEERGKPYGLRYPTLSDARLSLTRVHADDSTERWSTLLARAGLTGDETDRESLRRLVEVMLGADTVTRLAAHALRIRACSHDHLSEAEEIIRSAQ